MILLITLSIFLDIFNSQKYLNLTAIKVISVTLIPWSLTHFKYFLNNSKPFRILLAYLLLMAGLAIIYGFLIPWEDTTGVRGFKDLAAMRSILHLGSWILELNVCLYLGDKLKSEENFEFFKKSTLIACLLVLTGAVFEKIFHFDFYHFFTAGREYLNPDRLRGFNYEPRGLAQNSAYSIFFLLTFYRQWWSYLLISLLLFFGFYFTMSMTGFLILFSGLVIFIIFQTLNKKTKQLKSLFASLSIFAIVSTGVILSKPNLKTKIYYHVVDRLYFLKSGSLAERFEVFDAAAVNYFSQNPKHLLLGTGPGMIYLPASEYIIPRDQRIWGKKFEALPHMGLILILSNTGVLGVLIWLYGLFIGLKERYQEDKQHQKIIISGILLILYLIQVRYFFLFGIALILFPRKEQTVSAP